MPGLSDDKDKSVIDTKSLKEVIYSIKIRYEIFIRQSIKLSLLAEHSLATKVNELMMIDQIRHEGPAGKSLGFFQQLPPRVLKEIHHISEEAQEAYNQQFGLVPYTPGSGIDMNTFSVVTCVGPHGFPVSIKSVSEVIKIAEEIGEFLLKNQEEIVRVNKKETSPTEKFWVKQKPDGSSLTSMDIAANKLFVERLRILSPDKDAVGIISEENNNDENLNEAKKISAWCVDPLDNTGAYKRGESNWSVTIGFTVEGVPTGGVVFYPRQGRLFFTGDDGKSYFRNSKGLCTELMTTPKEKVDLLSGTSVVTIALDPDLNGSATPITIQAKSETVTLKTVQKREEHTDRYWTIALPRQDLVKEEHEALLGGNDIAEFGNHYYAWDIIAPAAIVARADVMYLNREGELLHFFEKIDGHNDFEMPQKGFVAGNIETLRNIGLYKHQNQMSYNGFKYSALGLQKSRGAFKDDVDFDRAQKAKEETTRRKAEITALKARSKDRQEGEQSQPAIPKDSTKEAELTRKFI